MARGEKYIIEVAEVHTHYSDDNVPYCVYRIKGFNSLMFDSFGLSKLQKLSDFEKQYIELMNKYTNLRNEHCLMCGKYKEAHNGACEGCKYEY